MKLHEYLTNRYDEKYIDLEASKQSNKIVVDIYSNKKENTSKPLLSFDCSDWVKTTNKPNIFEVINERAFIDALRKIQGSPFVNAKEIIKKDANRPILIINGKVEIDYTNNKITIFNNQG